MKKHWFLLASAAALAVFLPKSADADLGPKPTMRFIIVYETKNRISLSGGEQLECKDKLCSEVSPLGQYGPQRFSCGENSCGSLAYGYSPYQKLRLKFSDKTRESNIFSANAFDAVFNVRVAESRLIVEAIDPAAVPAPVVETLSPLPGPGPVSPVSAAGSRLIAVPLPRAASPAPLSRLGGFLSFSRALIITLVLELLVSVIYLSVTKISGRVLIFVVLANVISLPLVWFLFPLLNLPPLTVMALSEGFAVLFETYFIYLLNKRFISFRQSLVLNVLNNFVSLFVGGAVYVFLAFFR